MGLLTFVGRIVLMVVNVVFVIVSLALVIGGFLLRFANNLIDVDQIMSSISDTSDQLFNEPVDTSEFDIGAMLNSIAIIMIVVGLALLAVSVLGCCSACCNFTTLMLVYAIILIVLVVIQVAVLAFIYAAPDTLKATIKAKAEETLSDYEGLRGTTMTSVGWNWASRQYKCCGVNNNKDFENKGSWKGTGNKADGNDVITPIVCCKDLPTTASAKDNCAGKTGVVDENAIQPNSNKDQGCVDAMWTKLVDENRDSIYLTVFLFCLLAQVVLIVFACLGYKDRGIKGGLI